MKRTLVIISIAILMQCGVAYGAEDSYATIKMGLFMPNGKGLSSDGKSNGLSKFDSGYSVDMAFGFKPASYAAVELGTGYFTASGNITDTTSNVDMTAYGVPVTITAKGILNLEKFELYAGAGAGYYFCFIDNKVTFFAPRNGVDESSHGNAIGYHAVAGGDFIINDRFSVGAGFKFFSTKPEIELTNSAGERVKSKWEFGGTTLNVGLKFNF